MQISDRAPLIKATPDEARTQLRARVRELRNEHSPNPALAPALALGGAAAGTAGATALQRLAGVSPGVHSYGYTRSLAPAGFMVGAIAGAMIFAELRQRAAADAIATDPVATQLQRILDNASD